MLKAIRTGGRFQLSRTNLEHLNKVGWVAVCGLPPEELANAVISAAAALGRVVAGRGGKLIETLRPRASDEAPVASLSGKFGLDALPFHIDGSHQVVPCRYIVLGCLAAPCTQVPTILADREAIRLGQSERRLARTSIFHISNGRNSFYASILGVDPRFIRYDPGCMRPQSESAREALLLFGLKRLEPHSIAFAWNPGDILVIDNWRTFHGRGQVQEDSLSRELIRCMVA